MTIPNTLPPLILASASPRRKELLGLLKIPFEIQPADVDESPLANEAVADLVERLSISKAEHIAKDHRNHLVIAADTLVAIDENILSKPENDEEALSFLKMLSGNMHTVYSGYCLSYEGTARASVVSSKVFIRDLSEDEITWYLSTGEGKDKAGAYAIQGYGATLVEHIEGCYFNIVGLSLAHLCKEIKHFGFSLTNASSTNSKGLDLV